MTSKTSCNNSISYRKYILENVKQRIWFMVLSFITLFFMQTVSITMRIENFLNSSAEQPLNSYREQFPRMLNGSLARPFTVIILLLAVICAVSGYAYLHQPEKSDFFHGFPLKRIQWFNISYIGGLLMFLIPYLSSSLCTMVIATSKGVLVSSNFLPSVLAVFGGILGYLILYHTAILAMMLTGRLLSGTLAAFVLIVYYSMAEELFSGLFSTFYDTLYTPRHGERSLLIDSLSNILSPLDLYQSLTYRTAANYKLPLFLLFAIAVIAGIWLLACYLYQKRSLESAGNALAFQKSASVIKILIAIPGALFFGFFADSFYYNTGNKWIIFFSILAVILLCGIIEFIYTQDLRQIFKRKTSSLISIIGVVGILTVMQLDLFGYDTWLPKKSDIKSMALYSDSYLNYFDYVNNDFESSESYYLLQDDDAQTKKFDLLYQLAEEGISNHNMGMHFDNLYENSMYDPVDYTGITVRFNKTNGKSVYRSYVVKCGSLLNTLDELCQEESYRRKLFPAFYITGDEIETVILYDIRFDTPLKLTGEEKENLLKAYQQDLLQVDIHKLQEDNPIGSFAFQLKSNEIPSDMFTSHTDDYIRTITNLYLFDTYENTLKLLEEYGYSICTEINPEDVLQMTYTRLPSVDYNSSADISLKDTSSVPVTDPEEIRRLLDRTVYSLQRIAGGWNTETDYIEVWLKGETLSRHYSLLPKE